jgi:porin
MFTQYLSGAFRLNTFGLGDNTPNFSLIPFANWGARLKWQPDDYWKFQASFMNGHPRNFADDGFRGLELDFQPGKGSFFIAEGVRRWNHSDADRAVSGGLPGQVILGGYYDTGQFDFLDGTGRKETGLSNLYAIVRQKVWEREPISDRGIHVWTSLGYGWEEEINTFPYYWSGGLIWQGPFGTRTEDTLALGFARGWYSDSLPGQSTETVLECAYNWYLNDVWTVTPDIQYIVRPGGTGGVSDSLLLGMLLYLTY